MEGLEFRKESGLPPEADKAFPVFAFAPSLYISQMFLFHGLPPSPILYVADGFQTNQEAEAAKNLKEKKKDSETHISSKAKMNYRCLLKANGTAYNSRLDVKEESTCV